MNDMNQTSGTPPRLAMYAGFPEAVRSGGIRAAAETAVRMGYGAVEFLEFVHRPERDLAKTAEEARELKSVLDAYGLTVSCFSVVARLWEPEQTEAARQRQVERLARFSEIAAALGAPFLHHTLATAWAVTAPYGEVFDAALPLAVRVATYAAECGLTTLYEPQGFYFNGVDGFGRFYRAMKGECPSVGVCGDVGNPLCVDEDPVPFFREFAGEIRHVHLKDFRICGEGDRPAGGLTTRGGGYLADCTVGTGDVDLEACLAPLSEAGYRGAFSVEHAAEASAEASRRLLAGRF